MVVRVLMEEYGLARQRCHQRLLRGLCRPASDIGLHLFLPSAGAWQYCFPGKKNVTLSATTGPISLISLNFSRDQSLRSKTWLICSASNLDAFLPRWWIDKEWSNLWWILLALSTAFFNFSADRLPNLPDLLSYHNPDYKHQTCLWSTPTRKTPLYVRFAKTIDVHGIFTYIKNDCWGLVCHNTVSNATRIHLLPDQLYFYVSCIDWTALGRR